jgi:hypothetical protein
MQPTRELMDQLYREEVFQARKMSIEDKFFAGGRLFELACVCAVAGIRNDHPNADERQVREMLGQRIALGRRLEQSS